ncbi:hypothetical protein BJY52DRAFT_274303 [Lactarius psammicola]|nr:hypothetical protein BJY52DRAFT_274303 [Lactarius psammicola]
MNLIQVVVASALGRGLSTQNQLSDTVRFPGNQGGREGPNLGAFEDSAAKEVDKIAPGLGLFLASATEIGRNRDDVTGVLSSKPRPQRVGRFFSLALHTGWFSPRSRIGGRMRGGVECAIRGTKPHKHPDKDGVSGTRLTVDYSSFEDCAASCSRLSGLNGLSGSLKASKTVSRIWLDII